MNIFTKNAINAKRIIELLALNGADMNAKNFDLWTPLHIAVKRGNYDTVEALLSINSLEGINNKVDIDCQGGLQRWTALHLATFGSYYRITSLLIENKADLFISNVTGKSPFTHINNNLLMVKIVKKA